MATGQLTLTPTSVDGAATNGVENRTPPSVDTVNDDGVRASRLPRWTRQEILVLIQGKRVAENRVRRGRAIGSEFGSVEPKWASVSSYCKRHGVNRGPVQCRKRWSNLSGDYKKIKEWEMGIKEETESFWVMRNDLRRERKLPGFFDREVYDILEQGAAVAASASASAVPELALALAPAVAAGKEKMEVGAEEEVVFDSSRGGTAEEGLFSDAEAEERENEARVPPEEVAAPIPISVAEKAYEPDFGGFPGQAGTPNERHSKPNPDIGSSSQEERKRKRSSMGGDYNDEKTDLECRLIDALERNGRLLSAQLEAQTHNFELDRNQRKDQANDLLAVLNKLADALGRIADKL